MTHLNTIPLIEENVIPTLDPPAQPRKDLKPIVPSKFNIIPLLGPNSNAPKLSPPLPPRNVSFPNS